MRYLKIYEDFQSEVQFPRKKSIFLIKWKAPSDEYIKEEMHELLNNVEWFFKPENFEKVYAKLPSIFHHIVSEYLKIDTNDKEEIKKMVMGKTVDQIGFDPDHFKKNPTEEIKKEVFNLIKSGSIEYWSPTKIEKTGNMGDLTQVFGPNSGRKGWMGELHFDKGVDGINQLREKMEDPSFNPSGFDIVAAGYLRNYDELLAEKTISKPAPFILNIGETTEKPYHLIGGHKRSCIALQLGLSVSAWSIEF